MSGAPGKSVERMVCQYSVETAQKEEICAPVSFTSFELCDDCRYVVVLFLRADAPNPIHDCSQQSLARQFPMLPQRFN